MQAVSEPAELGDRALELALGLDDQRRRRRARRPARAAQSLAEHAEPPVGAVLEAALEPAALVVAGLEDPQARRTEVADLRADVGLKASVRGLESGGGRDGLDQAGIVED